MVLCRVLDPECPELTAVQEAVHILRQGGVVAYPTDTVYGLAVDAYNETAVSRLYTVKQRPMDKAFPLIIGAVAQLEHVCESVPQIAWRLIEAFWPGPLTLLLEPHARIPVLVRGQSPRIGVRMPDSQISRALAVAMGGAITASSANLAGKPVALCAADVVTQLAPAVDMILDGGAVSSAEVSTVLDVLTAPPCILRTGKISLQLIEEILNMRVLIDNSSTKDAVVPS